MFTGIISHIGVVKSVNPTNGGKEFVIEAPAGGEMRIGESISVSGICSTVISQKRGLFSCFYMPETLAKATASHWVVGSKVNIEASLRVGSSLSGHFVFGHVDGRARITSIEAQGESKLFWFSLDTSLLPYVVSKGSVALDGVSLTVVETSSEGFSVAFIPYTLEHTTFGLQKEGGEVNIEIDMLARYIREYADRTRGNSKH